jgi:uncharacterized protein YeaO (DUF488 family)
MIVIKRAYDGPSRVDGTSILVDRLWPRGIKKEKARVEKWMRELGPSNELRKFFGHDPSRWTEFRKRYLAELKRPGAEPMLGELLKIASRGTLTLIYSAKDKEHNQAIGLKSYSRENCQKLECGEWRARTRSLGTTSNFKDSAASHAVPRCSAPQKSPGTSAETGRPTMFRRAESYKG